jgi:hypothetical protein
MEQARSGAMDHALDPASIDRIGTTLADVLQLSDPAEPSETALPGFSPNVLCFLAGVLDGKEHSFVERDGELFLLH